jgi:hypothetical protein
LLLEVQQTKEENLLCDEKKRNNLVCFGRKENVADSHHFLQKYVSLFDFKKKKLEKDGVEQLCQKLWSITFFDMEKQMFPRAQLSRTILLSNIVFTAH